jgi:flagellar motility protein MotE (MotC chaperone)
MLDRLRLLPTVMLVAAMLLGLKVVHMIGGLGDVAVISLAQAQAKEEPSEPSKESEASAEGEHAAADKSSVTDEHAEKPTPATAHGGADRPMSVDATKAALAAQTEELNQAHMTPAEIAVLGSLSARREEIDKRAQEFDMREQLLAAAEKRVEARIAELKAIEAKINGQIAANDKATEDRLNGVVQMYETMKPKDAARIFERLDMGVLIDVAKRMNPRKMSAVLAAMDPVAAQDLTVELATGDRMPDVPAQKAEVTRQPAPNGTVVAPGKAG